MLEVGEADILLGLFMAQILGSLRQAGDPFIVGFAFSGPQCLIDPHFFEGLIEAFGEISFFIVG